MRRWVPYVSAVAAVLLPFVVRAATFDVLIRRADVTFVPEKFFVGDTVRVYATLQNVGDRDAFGNAFFSENGTAVGTAPPFSVKARSNPEDVWVDWQPATLGDRQIFIRVVTAPETRDEDLTNNEMIVPVFVDRDTDHDGIGDREDTDDDGDGLPDTWEEAHGLNPKDPSDANRDPDGDGVSTIDEYRRGTDPFTNNTPAAGAASGSVAPPSTPPPATSTGVTPAPSHQPAPAVAPLPPKPTLPASRTAPSRPTSAPRREATTETVTLAAPALPRSPKADAVARASVDDQLEQLLGPRAQRKFPVLPVAALVVAIAAVAGAVVLLRRRAHE